YLLASALLFLIDIPLFISLPTYRAHLQHLIPSKVRATVLSAESMIDAILSIIFLSIGGPVLDAIGPRNGLALAGLLAIPSVFAFAFLKLKK
ncbi:MAG: hypothetical protein AABY01_03835, partial [Nanoarchaeota archaeon]